MNIKDYAGTVMNTIPLIFNQRQIQRTVIGGSEFVAPLEQCLPVSIVIINRGARQYRSQIFQRLQLISQVGMSLLYLYILLYLPLPHLFLVIDT